MKTIMLIFACAVGAGFGKEAAGTPTGFSWSANDVAIPRTLTVEELAAQTGKWVVTTDEMKDIVRAMDILMPGEPNIFDQRGQIEGGGYGATLSAPEWLSNDPTSREKVDAGLAKLKWARAILAKWKAKTEAVK